MVFPPCPAAGWLADRLTCVLFWHSPAFMAGLCLQKPIQTLWPVSAFDSEFIRHCLPEYPAMRSNRKCLRFRLRQHPDRPLREPEHSHCLPGSPAMRSNRKCPQYRRRPDHRLYWGIESLNLAVKVILSLNAEPNVYSVSPLYQPRNTQPSLAGSTGATTLLPSATTSSA